MPTTSLPKRQQGDFLYNAMFVRLTDATVPYDRLKGWGNCTTGTLANGLAAAVNMPVQDVVFDPNTALPPAGATIIDWAFTTANLYIVYSNGWCYSAGRSDYGQLGHGDLVSRSYLKRIDYFVTNGISVNKVWAAGAASATSGGGCAYFSTTGGSSPLYACGAGAAGNLGNASFPTSNLSTPAACSGITTTVLDVQVSASGGTFSAYVVDSAGNLKVAGLNGNGQLGVGNFSNVTGGFVPATKTPGDTNLTNISSVSVTDLSALARDSSGNVWSTGYNAYGQLGLGDTATQNRFKQISGLSGISQVGIGGGTVGFAYAISSAGILYTWGYNGANNLFKNNTSVAYSPSTTVFSTGQIVKVFLPKGDQLGGNSQMFAQTNDNKFVYAGVDNGQLGVPNTAVPGAYKYVLTPQFDSIADVFVHGTSTAQRLFILGTTGAPGYQNVYACGSNVDSICNGGFSSNIMPANVDCALIPLGSFACGWQ